MGLNLLRFAKLCIVSDTPFRPMTTVNALFDLTLYVVVTNEYKGTCIYIVLNSILMFSLSRESSD